MTAAIGITLWNFFLRVPQSHAFNRWARPQRDSDTAFILHTDLQWGTRTLTGRPPGSRVSIVCQDDRAPRFIRTGRAGKTTGLAVATVMRSCGFARHDVRVVGVSKPVSPDMPSGNDAERPTVLGYCPGHVLALPWTVWWCGQKAYQAGSLRENRLLRLAVRRIGIIPDGTGGPKTS